MSRQVFTLETLLVLKNKDETCQSVWSRRRMNSTLWSRGVLMILPPGSLGLPWDGGKSHQAEASLGAHDARWGLACSEKMAGRFPSPLHRAEGRAEATCRDRTCQPSCLCIAPLPVPGSGLQFELFSLHPLASCKFPHPECGHSPRQEDSSSRAPSVGLREALCTVCGDNRRMELGPLL